MPTPPLSEELRQQAADAFLKHGNQKKAAAALGIPRATFQSRLRRAAEAGLLGTKPILPGFRISQVTSTPKGDYVQQKPERGEEFELPAGHTIKGVSALVDGEGRTIQQWVKTGTDVDEQRAILSALVAGFAEDVPRASAVSASDAAQEDLLNQYVVTDSHFGMLAWREETGSDYDLRIAEQLLIDWFSAAIANSPPAHTAVFA